MVTAHPNVIIPNTTRFFRSKKATSPETAIEVNTIDWIEMGFGSNDPTTSIFSFAYPYIVRTSDNTYYLDEEKVKDEISLPTQLLRMVQTLIMAGAILGLFFGIVYLLDTM